MLTLLTIGWSGIGVASVGAQESGLQGDTAYEAPQLGYEVEWADPWAYLEGSEEESTESKDHIDLVSQGQGIIHISGFVGAVPDLETELEGALENIGGNVEDFEVVGQATGDGFAAAFMTYASSDGGVIGEYLEISDLTDRATEEGVLYLQLQSLAENNEDVFTSAQESITLGGDPIFLSDYEDTLESRSTGGNDRDQDTDTDRDAQDEEQDDDRDQDQDDDQDQDQDEDQDRDQDQDDNQDSDRGTAETGLDGNVYTNAEYGWSVEFDEDVWTGSEVEAEGVVGIGLTAAAEDTFGFANLLVRDNNITDPAECLENEAETLNPDIFVDLTPARRLDPPETARDAEGEIYTTTFTSGDTEVELAFYIECREVQDATLVVQVAVEEREYEDLLPDIEELLAGIDTGGGADADQDQDQGQDEDTDQDQDEDTDQDADRDQDRDQDEDQDADQRGGGETYTDPDNGWSLEYDPDVWTLIEVTEPEYQGLNLTPVDPAAIGSGFISMLVYTEGAATAEDCFDNLEGNLSESEVFTNFNEARDLDPPETDPDAVGGNIYTTTFAGQEGDVDLAYYIECREVEGGILTIQMATEVDKYEDALPEWEALLANIDSGA
jgi:hypothetical protein